MGLHRRAISGCGDITSTTVKRYVPPFVLARRYRMVVMLLSLLLGFVLPDLNPTPNKPNIMASPGKGFAALGEMLFSPRERALFFRGFLALLRGVLLYFGGVYSAKGLKPQLRCPI